MSEDELSEAMSFIEDHFMFLESKDGNLSTIDSIIDRTKQAIMRGANGVLIIDPYNYIESTGGEGAQQYQPDADPHHQLRQGPLHPRLVCCSPSEDVPEEDGTYAVPKGMNISGSAAWFAKADLGVTVHRTDDCVEIHCWKSRFKWVGSQGVAMLQYNMSNGRYENILRRQSRRHRACQN